MSEYIDRNALKDDIAVCCHESSALYAGACCGVCGLIEKAPAVDAVPVVRCKDCQHWHHSGWCKLIGQEFDRWPGYYCADGKRKER